MQRPRDENWTELAVCLWSRGLGNDMHTSWKIHTPHAIPPNQPHPSNPPLSLLQASWRPRLRHEARRCFQHASRLVDKNHSTCMPDFHTRAWTPSCPVAATHYRSVLPAAAVPPSHTSTCTRPVCTVPQTPASEWDQAVIVGHVPGCINACNAAKVWMLMRGSVPENKIDENSIMSSVSRMSSMSSHIRPDPTQQGRRRRLLQPRCHLAEGADGRDLARPVILRR